MAPPTTRRHAEQKRPHAPDFRHGSKGVVTRGDEITASGLTSVGQNRVIWNSRACAKPTSIGLILRLNKQGLESVLWRCRTLYNVALEQRKLWWERGQGIGASYYQQKAELPDLKAACPEFGAIHAHVLQDVILRLDRAFQAFFRRVKAGETPGYPRFQGTRPLPLASPSQSMAMARRWMTGPESSPRSGGSPSGWSSPTGRDAQDGHHQPGSRRLVRLHLLRRCAGAPLAAHGTGDRHRPGHRGVRYALRWDTHLFIRAGIARPSGRSKPRNAVSVARKKGQQPQAQGGHTARQGASDGATPATRLSPQDGAGARAEPTTRSIMRTCSPPTWSSITIWPSRSVTRGGAPSSSS